MATWKTWVDGEKLYAADINALQTGKVDSDGTASPIFAGMALGKVDGILSAKEGVLSGSTISGDWQRKGVVVPLSEEAVVLYDTNPQILTGTNVFKMWYSGVGGICYCESADGLTWTQYASNSVTTGYHHGVVKVSGVYYLYVCDGTNLDLYTSANGVTFTLAKNNALSVGAGGAWDNALVSSPYVWVEGATWYMLYDGQNGSSSYIGLATSADGLTWTKDGGNPVISDDAVLNAGAHVEKIGATYYCWLQRSPFPNKWLPTDIYLYSSTNLVTWTRVHSAPVFPRWAEDEGWNNDNDTTGGQTADPSIVEVAGKTYLFYTGKPNHLDSDIKLAVADYTIAQLITRKTQPAALMLGNGNVGLGTPASSIFRLDIDGREAIINTLVRLRALQYQAFIKLLAADGSIMLNAINAGIQSEIEFVKTGMIDTLTTILSFRGASYTHLLEIRGPTREVVLPRHAGTTMDYANDAAAGAAGLSSGAMYTVTGTNPKQLAIKI